MRQTNALLAEKARRRRAWAQQAVHYRPPRTHVRTRRSFELTFACPTPAYQTPPEIAQKPNKNYKLDPTDDKEGIQTHSVE